MSLGPHASLERAADPFVTHHVSDDSRAFLVVHAHSSHFVFGKEASNAFLRSHASVNTSSHVPEVSVDGSSGVAEVSSSSSDLSHGASLISADMGSSVQDERSDHLFHRSRERFPAIEVVSHTSVSASRVVVSAVSTGVVTSVVSVSSSGVMVSASTVSTGMSVVTVGSSGVSTGMSVVSVSDSTVVAGGSVVSASMSSVSMGSSVTVV